MTRIGIRCAVVELLVAEEATPAPDAIALLDGQREQKSETTDVVIVRMFC